MEKKEIINNYELIEKIGFGQSTEVYKARNINTKELRALKIIYLDQVKNLIQQSDGNLDDYINRIKNEINNTILCAKNNENSLKFYEYFQTEKKFVIVLELCDQNLAHFKRGKNFTSKEIYEILTQLNNTFKIMKKNGIVHRDLKPENILLKHKKDGKYTVKLCDYGTSKLKNLSVYITRTGTLGYSAPEVMKVEEDINNFYNSKCDLWSLGIIIYELFFKKKPYTGKTEYALCKNIDSLGKRAIKKTNDAKLDDLLSKLLESNPSNRITWNEYFSHPFFNQENNNRKKGNEEKENKTKIKEINDNNSENLITIIYKKIDNENNIRIFGKEFVENNKDNCKIIIKKKEYRLREYFGVENNEDILEIKLAGINNITNLSYMFSNCEALKSISGFSKLNTEKVTNLSHLFSYCESIESLPDISLWNTSNVTNMSDLFSNCLSIKSLPDISKWDTSKVSNMSYMFFNCKKLESLPDISCWKTNKVSDMSYLFFNCESLTSEPNISSWAINSLNYMNGMFYGCNFPLKKLSKFIRE